MFPWFIFITVTNSLSWFLMYLAEWIETILIFLLLLYFLYEPLIICPQQMACFQKAALNRKDIKWSNALGFSYGSFL